MDITTVTDPSDIAALLSEYNAKEQEVEDQLQRRLEVGINEAATIDLIDVVEEQVVASQAKTEAMLETISATCAIAESVSAKVRELDVSRSRLLQVQERVEMVADRKNAAERLAGALAADNFEIAAEVARRFAGPTADLPQALIDGIDNFGKLMVQRLEAAEAEASTDAVLRFAKLIPGGAARSGSVVYAQHLRQLVEKTATEHRAQLLRGEVTGDQMIYISVLSSIFEDVAMTLHDHNQTILESFGQEGLQLTLQELQLECDKQAGRVIRACMDKRGLKALSQRAGLRYKEKEGQQAIDPQEIGVILDELALISDRTEKYEAFMANMQGGGGRGKGPSGLRELVQETIGQYIQLEAFLVDLNVQKAMEVDELPSIAALTEQPCTSSVVDEVFFILKTTLRRALSFTNEDALAAILNHVMSIIEGDFRLYLAKRLDKCAIAPAKLCLTSSGCAAKANGGVVQAP
jgi:hypothetical protein